MRGLYANSPVALEERCAALVQLQAWPIRDRLDWKGWLSNFHSSEDQFFARCLLESFLYFNENHSVALLLSAFHALSRQICATAVSHDERRLFWREFLQRVLLTYSEDQIPSQTDSGVSFARRGRIELGIPQERILAPGQVLERLARDPSIPVVDNSLRILGSVNISQRTFLSGRSQLRPPFAHSTFH
jgi:hypothetical protein